MRKLTPVILPLFCAMIISPSIYAAKPSWAKNKAQNFENSSNSRFEPAPPQVPQQVIERELTKEEKKLEKERRKAQEKAEREAEKERKRIAEQDARQEEALKKARAKAERDREEAVRAQNQARMDAQKPKKKWYRKLI